MYTIDFNEKIKILEDRIRILEDQNKLYKNIINNLPFGIQIFDKQGETLLENKRQKEILGLPTERNNKTNFLREQVGRSLLLQSHTQLSQRLKLVGKKKWKR